MTDAVASKTYNFKAIISNLRQITAGNGTFATGQILRDGQRPVYLKITDSALSKALASGLDLTARVNLFGRFEAKPFTTAAGLQKTAQVFVVLSISPIRSAEEIAAIVAAKAQAEEAARLEAEAVQKADLRREKRRIQAANRRAAKKLAEAVPA